MPNSIRTVPDIRDEYLDGAEDVQLAPVRGTDTRRKLEKEYFQKDPHRFTAKFCSALALIAGCWVLIGLDVHWAATGGAVIVLGLLYGHLVELQHECLHEHAYRSRRLNRLTGFVCGVFMMSSFTHYKVEHLRHHAFLGTPQNQEFFNYRFRNLNSIPGFIRAAFSLWRYIDVFRDMGRSLTGRKIPRIIKKRDQQRIRSEYRAFSVILVAGILFTVLTGNLLLVFAWLLPAILVAEATHYMIELPEHFGLNTQTDPNVLTNTRTISASRFAQWFTNYNNLHTAHHYHQGVPMARIEGLSEENIDKFEVVDSSYWDFYKKVFRGELEYQHDEETCMTR